MLLDELAQELGQARCDEILRDAEPQPAAEARAGEIAAGAVGGVEDGLGKPGHRLSVGGQAHRVGVAHEETPASGGLELPDMLADGGLLQAETAPRLGEVAGLRDGEEAFQMGRLEHDGSGYRDL